MPIQNNTSTTGKPGPKPKSGEPRVQITAWVPMSTKAEILQRTLAAQRTDPRHSDGDTIHEMVELTRKSSRP